MKSIFSQTSSSEGAYIFEIEFRDICWDSVLKEASFIVSYIEYDLWEKQVIPLTSMTDTS